jgi:hypothetical protein
MKATFIKELLVKENLLVDQILRDGPRYWVAAVRQGQSQLILKAVINDETWSSPGTSKQFTTSDQLRAEIIALQGFGSHEDKLAGRVPKLVASSLEPPVWSLRERILSQDMAGTVGSLLFRPEFYELVAPDRLVDYIMSYQEITPELGELAAATPQSDQTSLNSKMIIADLDYPQSHLTRLSTRVNAYLRTQESWHDQQVKVLAHGEVYPPHIFLEDDEIILIDWENFSLNNPVSDIMQVWIRAYDNPPWRAALKDALWQKSSLAKKDLEKLWDLELLYQSSRNLNYLHYSVIESSEQIRAAAASFTANIEEVLHRDDQLGL